MSGKHCLASLERSISMQCDTQSPISAKSNYRLIRMKSPGPTEFWIGGVYCTVHIPIIIIIMTSTPGFWQKILPVFIRMWFANVAIVVVFVVVKMFHFRHSQSENLTLKMSRKDVGKNVVEIKHNDGTDRWLVVKKQLDASKISISVSNVFCERVLMKFTLNFTFFLP